MILILIMFGVLESQAKTPSPQTLKIIYNAAKKYNLDAQLLIKIAHVESKFKTNAKRLNKNGTVDYGMFQINSIHWTTTCKEFDIFKLTGNALCAAKLLSRIEKSHKDTDSHWVGRYHSKTPSRKVKYARMIELSMNGGS